MISWGNSTDCLQNCWPLRRSCVSVIDTSIQRDARGQLWLLILISLSQKIVWKNKVDPKWKKQSNKKRLWHLKPWLFFGASTKKDFSVWYSSKFKMWEHVLFGKGARRNPWAWSCARAVNTPICWMFSQGPSHRHTRIAHAALRWVSLGLRGWE